METPKGRTGRPSRGNAGSRGFGAAFEFDARALEIVPVERSETIPANWYVDERVHEIERAWLFPGEWQYLGPVHKLEEAGSRVVADIAGRPVVVVRGQDEVLRAFFNVCRHRGGPLATEDGCAQSLRCRYHGWTYGLDGRLRGVPEFEGVEDFDRDRFGLVPVTVEVWEGLVFVRLGDMAGERARERGSVGETFGGLSSSLPQPSMAQMTFAHRDRYPIDCNWKVYVDNFLEGYHLPFVHPELNRLLDYRHYVTELFARHSLQHAPVGGEDSPYPVAGGRALYYFLFPNVMLNVLPGRVQVNAVAPVSADRCEVIFDYFYDESALQGESMEAALRRDRDYSDRVQQQDIEICQHVQRGLASGAYDRGRFSAKRETGVHHFQALLKQAYARQSSA